MTRQAVSAAGARAIGPYSHGVWAGRRLYLSGQTPLDPKTGDLVQGDASAQTEQCFRNLFAVLEAAGLGPADVVKVNVYLTDMADFAPMNAIYATMFEQPYPARTTVAVAGLPRGARVEIEMIARGARGEGIMAKDKNIKDDKKAKKPKKDKNEKNEKK